jgi:hypothetical protein
MVCIRAIISFVLFCCCGAISHAAVPVDVTDHIPQSRIKIESKDNTLRLQWQTGPRATGQLVINTSGRGRLIRSLGIAESKGRDDLQFVSLLSEVDPSLQLTIGSRVGPPDKPVEAKWQVFFDNPHKRPHESFVGKLDVKKIRMRSSATRATVSIDSIEAGPFRGSLEITLYDSCPLVRTDFVVQTDKDDLAMFYGAGLVADRPSWPRLAWKDTDGALRRANAAEVTEFEPLAVRHRTIVAETDAGSVACFSPPHQFQFPRDYSNNLRYVWYGRPEFGTGNEVGFGIRQNKDGGGNFVPWFNAQPNVQHRLGMFLLLSNGNGEAAIKETLKYTHDDRFRELPGHVTMTSHYHMAIAVAAMEERKRGIERKTPPEYVNVLKDLGVQIVHLGEFHGDGHQRDSGPLRLPEMESMFHECQRWSDDNFLLVPGEEINTFLGLDLQGKHSGHWMSLFPRPVYWILARAEGQPFVEEHPKYGKVYRIGGRADMIRLIKEENGLVWSAHPRIKASSWTPDVFRNEDFFIADYWLGGAWKAMPGDLSRERLGERVLDLLDDMANWGHKKYVLGEVDVFKIDHTHELYGHMNVNYVQMDRVPRYAEGWQPLLDALRDGKFFVSTGEVLLPRFTIGGKPSGEVLSIGKQPCEVDFKVSWTFPLAFAEVISGDGQHVYRHRIDLSNLAAFSEIEIKQKVNLRGRRWARLEVWDIAANGAFTQPVWLTE